MANKRVRTNVPPTYRPKDAMFESSDIQFDYIDSVSKTCILNILRYFQAEKKKKGLIVPRLSVMERTAAACNISKRIVDKIISEYRKTGTLITSNPTVKYYGESRKKRKVKQKPLDPIAIRNVVFDMFLSREAVNCVSIHRRLRRYGLFPGPINCMLPLLKKVGIERKLNNYNVHCYKIYNYEDDAWAVFEETTDTSDRAIQPNDDSLG